MFSLCNLRPVRPREITRVGKPRLTGILGAVGVLEASGLLMLVTSANPLPGDLYNSSTKESLVLSMD